MVENGKEYPKRNVIFRFGDDMIIFDAAVALFFGIISQLIIGLISAVVAIIFENKYKLVDKITKLWHKIKNSKVELSLLVKYSSNMPFKDIKEIILDNLRKNYAPLRVHQNNENKLEVMVNNSFNISIEFDLNGDLSIQTNKITSHINFINKSIDDILNVFKDIKRDIGASGHQHDEKYFTVHLHLPFKNIYTRFNMPKGIVIDNYEVKMFHKTHHSEVVLKEHVLKIVSNQKDDLIDAIKCFTNVV